MDTALVATLQQQGKLSGPLTDIAQFVRQTYPTATAATAALALKTSLTAVTVHGMERVAGPVLTASTPVQDATAIAAALVAAGYSLPDIAAAIVAPGIYPNLTALELGQVMLAPSVAPGQTEDQLRALLAGVNKYAAADIQSALNVLFPQPSVALTIAASQQGGSRGVELWATPSSGQISTLYQLTSGGRWSNWEGPGFKGQPVPMQRVAAAQQNNGNVMLFALNGQGSVYAVGQGSPGGDWGSWSGPSLGGQPGPFVSIAASAQGGSRGVELWAVGADGQIWTLYQLTAGGAWSHWEGPGFKGQPVPMRQMAAGLQNNGNVMLFTLDDNGFVRAISQQSPGGDWGPWSGAQLGGQPHAFTQIAATEQKGSRGVEVWGLGSDGQIWTLFQLTPGGSWSHWEGPGFKGQPKTMQQIAAALENNGNVMLFSVDSDGKMWSIGQNSPGGDWGPWSTLPPL
jgi:hypothetical protein